MVENIFCEIQFGIPRYRTEQEHAGITCEFLWRLLLFVPDFFSFVGMQQIEGDCVFFQSVTQISKQLPMKCASSGYALQCKNLWFRLYALSTKQVRYVKCAANPQKEPCHYPTPLTEVSWKQLIYILRTCIKLLQVYQLRFNFATYILCTLRMWSPVLSNCFCLSLNAWRCESTCNIWNCLVVFVLSRCPSESWSVSAWPGNK